MLNATVLYTAMRTGAPKRILKANMQIMPAVGNEMLHQKMETKGECEVAAEENARVVVPATKPITDRVTAERKPRPKLPMNVIVFVCHMRPAQMLHTRFSEENSAEKPC